ncbi:MAG: radical SAM protein [Deltaproteobacteria bacterium]|nr:radical SAM protein [Deltaproteobacteria bacterium]
MAAAIFSTTFGPVPSRRLGQSMGINNIPSKVCTYACIYCQVGQTSLMQKNRDAFYASKKIVKDAQNRLAKAKKSGVPVDFLTFVPDGEPTLDIHLGETIDLLKPLGIPIAVITNSSLMGRMDVSAELARADWVSLKVDAVQANIWRKINRPQAFLQLAPMHTGMLEFAKNFSGKLVTETMLIRDLNESDDHLRALTDFLKELHPHTAYLSIPTRPPLEQWARRPSEDRLNRAYQIFSEKLPQVEYLIGYEGNAFAYTGDVAEDILNITAVHPMRKSAVSRLLSKAGATWEIVDRLVASRDLVVSEYEGHSFYIRKFGLEA